MNDRLLNQGEEWTNFAFLGPISIYSSVCLKSSKYSWNLAYVKKDFKQISKYQDGGSISSAETLCNLTWYTFGCLFMWCSFKYYSQFTFISSNIEDKYSGYAIQKLNLHVSFCNQHFIIRFISYSKRVQ